MAQAGRAEKGNTVTFYKKFKEQQFIFLYHKHYKQSVWEKECVLCREQL